MLDYARRTQSTLGNILVTTESTRGYKFECTKCGQCCRGGGVAATFTEALELSGDMTFRLGFQCSLLRYENRDIDDDQVSLMSDLGAAVLNSPEHGGRLVFHPYMRAYSHQSERAINKHCPMLLNTGECKIYDRRPSICKSVPLTTMLPNRELASGLAKFGDKYGCIIESSDSSVDVIGINENRKVLHEEIMYANAAILLVDAFRIKLQPGSLSMSTMLGCLVYDFHEKLKGKLDEAGMASENGVKFAKAQVRLLEIAIAEARQRKCKEELAVTRNMISDLNDLKNYLKKSEKE